MKQHPRRALDPGFRQSIAESRWPRTVLARKVRFSHSQALDTTLRLDRLSATPLLVGRLTALATIIGYTGPIFQDDATPVEPEPQTNEAGR